MARRLATLALLLLASCGLDLDRRAGSISVYLLNFPQAADRVVLSVQHGGQQSSLEYQPTPEVLVESAPAGDSDIEAHVRGSLRAVSNRLVVTVRAGELVEVGLTLTDDPGADPDGDLRANEVDDCPFVANAAQTDTDQDGIGDDCDSCRAYGNPRQEDLDADGLGDLCDPDQDGDGVLDVFDQCPRDPSGSIDADGDDVCDSRDNCLGVPNSLQADCDQDELGDYCDLDLDGDGIVNGVDLCPFAYDPTQAGAAGSGVGDACVDDPVQCRPPPAP